jgi:hypothetical protein
MSRLSRVYIWNGMRTMGREAEVWGLDKEIRESRWNRNYKDEDKGPRRVLTQLG